MPGIGAGPAIAAIVTSARMKQKKSTNERTVDTPKNENLTAEKQAIIDSVNKQLQAENLVESERVCPECGKQFAEIQVNGITIESCIYCKSLWFDLGELKELTGLLDDIPGMRLADRESKLPCPVCSKAMYRKVFMRRSNLVVDLCRDHGIYLENGELERALELSER